MAINVARASSRTLESSGGSAALAWMMAPAPATAAIDSFGV
jgi:hypothetical protein